jgi:chemotaxis protein methyltransferase CheR
MERLLLGLTVHTTAMFRDPGFYSELRRNVLPRLGTYPFLRIWVAGCSTGEEVYSLAILLEEEGLAARSRVYATDLSEAVLERAKRGIYPLAALKDYTENYIQAGGRRSLSEYYTADDDHAVFRPALRERIVFAAHNLATDSSFNEFQLILCRNVMIYFKKPLQDRVHQLLYESLGRLGVLALGRSETMQATPFEPSYQELNGAERIYQKVR